MKKGMKFYLAGKYGDRELLKEKIQEIKNLGYTPTWGWMEAETHSHEAGIMGYFAKKDIDGVVDADFLIVVMDDRDYAYRGTFTEIGAALALKKPVFLYCPHDRTYAHTNCFFFHPGITHFARWGALTENLPPLK